MFSFADQPDVIRALQRDQYYMGQLREQSNDLCSRLVGGRQLRTLQDEISLVSDACYFGLTSLAGRSTLGEEYCDLMQVSTRNGSAATSLLSGLQRLALFLFEVVVPYALRKCKRRGRAVQVPHNGHWFTQLTAHCWNRVMSLIVGPEAPGELLIQLHLALFYLFGQYLQLSKRVTGVRYVVLRKTDPRKGYQFLGVLILIQLTVTAIRHLRKVVRQRSGSVEDNSRPQSYLQETNIESEEKWSDNLTRPNCTLCLSEREQTTATECGHLYCWACICESIDNKPECPMCRRPISANKLIRLHQYL